jgi:hypothetical protein
MCGRNMVVSSKCVSSSTVQISKMRWNRSEYKLSESLSGKNEIRNASTKPDAWQLKKQLCSQAAAPAQIE